MFTQAALSKFLWLATVNCLRFVLTTLVVKVVLVAVLATFFPLAQS